MRYAAAVTISKPSARERRRTGRARWQSRAAVLAVIGVIGTGAVAATADADASDTIFSFADTTALATSCADLVKGVAVEVRNDSASTQTLHVRFGPVSDSAGTPSNASTVCGGLTATITKALKINAGGETATVEAGASATVELKGVRVPPAKSAGAQPASGAKTKTAKQAATTQTAQTFSTTLVVFAGEGLVSRRDISVSEVKGAGVIALPLADSRSVTHQRYKPADDWQIWLPVKLAPGQTPALTPGQSVGVLTGDGGTTAVTYQGKAPRKLTDTAALLPLHINPVGAGSYSGKLTLASGTTTTVSLTVKHWWLIAGLVVFGGILLALLIQRYSGYWAPRGRLFQRIDDIHAEHDSATKRLKQAAGRKPWKGFALAGFDDLETAARNEIDNKSKWRTIFQIDQKLIDALDADLDALAAKVALLDTLTEAAQKLDAAITELDDPRAADLPPLQGTDRERKEPALATAAPKAEAGTALAADELRDKIDELTALGQLAGTLHDDQHELGLYWSQAKDLDDGLRGQPEHNQVAPLQKTLKGIRHELWTGDSADGLDVRGALDEARDTIAKLWSSLPAAPELERFAAGGGRYLAAEGIIAGNGGAEVAPGLSATDARKIITGAAWRQFAVVLASTAVALVTGISALYVGKPWGTPWDYIAAIFWGLMTQAVITAVAGAVDGLGPLGALRFGVGAHPRGNANT